MDHRFFRSVTIACVGSLSAACIDGAVGFIASGGRFHSLSFSLLAVALTALLALLLILAVRWLLVEPLLRHRHDPDALSIASAMAVTAFFVVYDAGSHHAGVVRLLEWGLDVTVAVVAAVGWYSLAVTNTQHTPPRGARIVGRALGFVMPLALLAAWVIFEAVNDVTSIGAIITVLALAVATGLTLLVTHRTSTRVWSLGVLGVFVTLIGFGAAQIVGLRGGSPAAATPAHARGAGKVRQVILLTVDTLRRDSLSCYGSSSVRTPNIDRIAADGCLFRHVTSTSSWTIPAFASMMTGLPAQAHGVVDATAVLPDTLVTLAERFREAGYATCGVVANGFLAPHRGFAQGLDRYDVRNIRLRPVSMGDALAACFERHAVEEATATRDVTDTAIEWIEQHKGRDFFLWLNYLDPHLPYEPPRPFIEPMNLTDELGYALRMTSGVRATNDLFGTPAERAWARSLYDAEVRYVDAEIGRFIAALEKNDIYDDALLVFGVDHGEEFWDHDGFEHGHSLYEELIGVPMIVKTPGASKARVVEEPVSLCDLPLTVLDLCGLPPMSNGPGGVSLAGLIDVRGEAPRPSRALFSGATLFRSNWQSVTFEGWKFIRSATTGQELLFKLADDPGERVSLTIKHPLIAARGRALLDEHERAMEAFREDAGIENPHLEMDKEELERLRTLGYL